MYKKLVSTNFFATQQIIALQEHFPGFIMMTENIKGGFAMKDISTRIRQLRQDAGMTQGELADRLHVTRQAVSNWENRKTRPDIETLDAISQVFSLDITELLYGGRPSHWTKKRIVQTAVYGSAVAVWLLLWLFALPAAKERAHYTCDFTIWLVVYFLCSFLSAACFPFLLSLVSDIQIQNKLVRGILLGIGIFLAAWFMIAWLALTLQRFFNFTGVFLAVFRTLFSGVAAPFEDIVTYMPAISGALLYLGTSRKNTECR